MNFLFRISTVILALFLTACPFETEDPPTEAPANVTVTAGESLVVLDWDVQSGLTYWVFYQQGSSTDLDDYENIITNAVPPFIVPRLVNGTQYAFAITSSKDGSKVGPFSSVVTATPRLLSPAVNWTVGTALTTENLLSIAFGNSLYVTVGNAATVFFAPYDYVSPGGVTGWSQATSLPVGLTANLTSVIHDGANFVALGDDGSIIRSADGDTWEAATTIGGTPATMNAIAVGVGAYVAVGNDGEIYTNNSADISVAWTAVTPVNANHLYGVSYVNGRFIAVGAAGTLLTSTDGTNWTAQTSNAGANILRQVAYGADTYVAVGDSGTIVSSADAVTWVLQADPTGGAQNLNAITFGPDLQFLIVGETGTLAYSTTGADASWAVTNAGATTLNSIAPSAVFIAVGDSGTNVSGK